MKYLLFGLVALMIGVAGWAGWFLLEESSSKITAEEFLNSTEESPPNSSGQFDWSTAAIVSPGGAPPKPNEVTISYDQYASLKERSNALDSIIARMSFEFLQGGKYLIPVDVDDATNDNAGNALAAGLRTELIESKRYFLSEREAPRLSIVLNGGSAVHSANGKNNIGMIVVSFGIIDGIITYPRVFYVVTIPWISSNFEPKKEAAEILGYLDRSVDGLLVE